VEKNLKIVFFGTPKFAAIVLEKLVDAGYIPSAVVCNPDEPIGRKQILTPPPIRQRIMNYESELEIESKFFSRQNCAAIWNFWNNLKI